MKQILNKMNKKLLIQVILLILILFIISTSYVIFFQKSLIEDKEVSNEITQNQKKTDNQINDLKYFSRDEKGNSYLLNAKTGYPDEENNYIINLNNVDAKITFDENNQIIVTSDKAVYNNSTYDTEFLGNVVINYNEHKLTTNKMNALISKNMAILIGNVVYKNNLTKLYADKIEYDLIERKSKISMFDKNKKIKVTHINNNGIN